MHGCHSGPCHPASPPCLDHSGCWYLSVSVFIQRAAIAKVQYIYKDAAELYIIMCACVWIKLNHLVCHTHVKKWGGKANKPRIVLSFHWNQEELPWVGFEPTTLRSLGEHFTGLYNYVVDKKDLLPRFWRMTIHNRAYKYSFWENLKVCSYHSCGGCVIFFSSNGPLTLLWPSSSCCFTCCINRHSNCFLCSTYVQIHAAYNIMQR